MTTDNDPSRTSRIKLALSRDNISAEAEGNHAVDRVITLAALAVVLVIGVFWALSG